MIKGSKMWKVVLLAALMCHWVAAETALPRFGAYEALVIESEVIVGVKHADDDKIWLMLNPAYKEREIQLKISASKGADYRKWFTGNEVLISAANQGKAANEWTDWVRTQQKYIEYWMDGRLILHLRRVD
jgi:hypothetical protein